MGSKASRFQEIVGSAQIASQVNGPIVITGIRVRSAPGAGVVSFTYASYKITLSTTQAYPNTLNGHTLPSLTYASNVGPDATVVYNAALSASSPGCAGAGPCPFDLVIPFATPFTYDFSKGRLLVDVVWSAATGTPSGSLDGVGFPDSTNSSIASVSGSSTNATGALLIAGVVFELDTNTYYYFPQLAFGGSWQTTVTYVNYSPQNVSCQTTFYTDSGTPLLAPFGGMPISSRTDALAPGADLHQQTTADLAGPTASGWAVAACSGPIKASMLYRFYKQGVAQGEAGVNAVTTPTTEFVTLRRDENRNRLRQPVHHAGHDHRHRAELGGTSCGDHGCASGAECARSGQHRSATWIEQLHRVGSDHVDRSDRQPVVERRSFSGVLGLAAWRPAEWDPAGARPLRT